MRDSIYRITLDLHDVSSQVQIVAKVHDTARRIYITLMENGKSYKLDEQMRAVMQIEKPSGTKIFNDCDIRSDGTIVYDITEQTTAATGVCRCELRLFGTDDQVIASPMFTIRVMENVYDDSEITDSDEWNELKRMENVLNELGDPNRFEEKANKETDYHSTDWDSTEKYPSSKVVKDLVDRNTSDYFYSHGNEHLSIDKNGVVYDAATPAALISMEERLKEADWTEKQITDIADAAVQKYDQDESPVKSVTVETEEGAGSNAYAYIVVDGERKAIPAPRFTSTMPYPSGDKITELTYGKHKYPIYAPKRRTDDEINGLIDEKLDPVKERLFSGDYNDLTNKPVTTSKEASLQSAYPDLGAVVINIEDVDTGSSEHDILQRTAARTDYPDAIPKSMNHMYYPSVKGLMDSFYMKGEVDDLLDSRIGYTYNRTQIDGFLSEKTDKVRIDFDGTNFSIDGSIINYLRLYDAHISSPDFAFVVYGDRAYLLSYVQDGEGMKEMRFQSVLAVTDSNGISSVKTSGIYVTSSDGVNIASVRVTDINSENEAYKASEINDSNRESDVWYPSNKAVSDAIDEANSTMKNLVDRKADQDDVSRLSESIAEVSKTVDNSVYLSFDDGKGWSGTVGSKIGTNMYDTISKMALVNARHGDKFRLLTNGVGGWAKRYYILDEDMIVLSALDGVGVFDGIVEITDINARYLAVNKDSTKQFEFYRYTQSFENATKISELKTDVERKIDIRYKKGLPVGEIKDGLFNIVSKKIDFTGGNYRYVEIDVSYLDEFYLTGVSHNNGTNYPFVAFVDESGNVTGTIKGVKNDERFVDELVSVKGNSIKKIYVNARKDYVGAYIAKQIDVYSAIDNAWINNNIQNRIIDEQKKNPFAWGSFDKGVIVFTFDDALSDIDLVEKLSEDYGIPVCFSAIPSKMQNITTATGENKKIHEILTIAEAHGNEVLCHSSVALSETSTDEEIYTNFVTNKKLLEEYGYTVNGIIEAGSGGGELTFDTRRSEKYLRILYEYSDNYGRNLSMPQYYTGRTYINRNIQNNHNVVDSCERNKTLLIFATHSVTDESTSSINTSESILRDLMSYVKTKDVYLLTFKGAYDMFHSSVLENRIKALEN